MNGFCSYVFNLLSLTISESIPITTVQERFIEDTHTHILTLHFSDLSVSLNSLNSLKSYFI